MGRIASDKGAGGRKAGIGVFSGLVVALSMFSRIPVPAFSWDDKSMRWAIGWWPLVGAIQGAVFCGLAALMALVKVPPLMAAAVLLAVPYAVTGGLLADGFGDTVDALSSRAPRERALEIMADPRLGSFAVLALCLHVVASFALLTQIAGDVAAAACVGLAFVLTRALAGLCVLILPSAHEGGLASAFATHARKGPARYMLAAWALVAAVLMVVLGGWAGLVALACVAAVLAWYVCLVRRRFGGVTGDTCGWLVQVGGLAALAGLAFGGLWL